MRKLLLISAIAALLASLTGCIPSSVDLGAQEIPEEITVVLGESAQTLNPYSPVLANRRVGHLIFSGLSRIGYGLAPEPDLLRELPTKSNGGISQDGRNVTYRLRDDAFWHDRKPVTAQDVAFTLEALRDGELTDDSEVEYSNIVEISVEDTRTLSLVLDHPDAPAVWRFAPFVLPAHKFEGESDIYSSPFWLAPTGSGPYRYESGLPAFEVRLRARDGGVDLRLVFGTVQTQREEFDSSVAAVWVDGPDSASPSESLAETSSAVWQVWLMNAEEGHETSDPALRQVFAGITPVDPSVTPATSDPWGADLKRSALATDAAEAAFDDAGWQRVGSTRAKGGVEAEIVVGSPTLLAENDVFVLGYRDKLNELGIRATTSVHPGWGQGGLFDDDPAPVGRYDIGRTALVVGAPFTIGWPFDTQDVPSIDRPNGSNVTRVADVRLDEAATAVRSSGDPDEAAVRMRRLGELLIETNTVLWDGQVPARWLTTGVSGVEAHPLPEYALVSAPGWSIDSATFEP